MNIFIKDGKHDVKEEIINGKIVELIPSLQNIYQNSLEIANIIMEESTYSEVGCRAISIYRMINYQLKKNKIIQEYLSMKEFDDIADEGGEYNDSWADNKLKPIYDVLNAWNLIEKINKKFDIKLKYKLIRKKEYTRNIKLELSEMFIKQNTFCIKMPHLITINWNHFVNVDAILLDHKNGEIYFRMKETFKGYDGYDGFFIKWKDPDYYEIIYL